MATKRKRRRNLWPFDAFRKTTVYHLRGRQRGVKESSTTRYKGHAIYKRADGYTVPSLDTSVFDDKREAQRFIDAMKRNPRRKRNASEAQVTAAYRAWRRAAEKGYGKTEHKSDMDRIDTKIRRLKEKYERLAMARKRNPTLSLPKNKFVQAKVRMKGGKVQVLVDESLLGHAGASGHVSLNPRRRRKAKRKTARRRKR